MQKKLIYDVHYAIGIRGKKLGEINMGTEMTYPDQVIDFLTSLQIATLDYGYPDPPLAMQVMAGQFERRDIGRKEWKQWYSSWRMYMRKSQLDEEQSRLVDELDHYLDVDFVPSHDEDYLNLPQPWKHQFQILDKQRAENWKEFVKERQRQYE